MAIRNPFLSNVKTLVYGEVVYPVEPGGILRGLPPEVEAALLALRGYTKEPDTEELVSTEIPIKAHTEAAKAAEKEAKIPVTESEIRAALSAAVEAARPENYAAAQTIAREKLLSLCGGKIPSWLTGSDRASLGLPQADEEIPVTDPESTDEEAKAAEKEPEPESPAEVETKSAARKPGRPRKKD